jgi:hypothetical protein
MLAHTDGREGNLSTGTQIQKLRMCRSPQWPPRKCQLLATLCVALSLALFALGGADPTGEFCLRTLGFVGPSAIMSPIFYMIAVSHAVIACVMCEE